MLQLDGVKMCKSLGNLVLARELMKQVEPDHLRLYLLSEHFRATPTTTTATWPALAERYGRLKAAAALGVDMATEGHPVLQQFGATMDDDFKAPDAIEQLDRTAASVLRGAADAATAGALRQALSALGFAFAGARGPANGDLTP